MSKKVSTLQQTFSSRSGGARTRQRRRDELVAGQNRDSRTNCTEDLEYLFQEAELLDEHWLHSEETKEPSLIQMITGRALSKLGKLVRKRH